MWTSWRCAIDLTESPCPLMGGLHPQFSPGPHNGDLDGFCIPDAEYFYLAKCGECQSVLWRRPNRHLAVWLPDDA